MEELIDKIMYSEDLSLEEKNAMIKKIIKAIHGYDMFINPNFYLRFDKKQENEEDKKNLDFDVELWYRKVWSDGRIYQGNTGYTLDEIITIMKNNLNLGNSNKR